MCDTAISVRMVSGLSGDRLREDLSKMARLEDVTGRASAFYLDDMQERGIHQETGHQSAVRYAIDRLSLPPSTAKEKVAVGRLLRELPGCDAAFCENRIGWSKLRLLARIATPETEKEWIAAAEKLTYVELQRAIAGLAKGDRPRKDKLGLPGVTFALTARVDGPTYAEWLRVRELMRAETDAEFIQRFLRLVLAAAHEDPADRPRAELVVTRCSKCACTSVSSPDGPLGLDELTAEMICCDSVSDETPEWLRRKILARDGHRCVICERSVELQVHHIFFRSNGGRTEPENLLSLCRPCHALVHAKYLFIQGSAPHGLSITDKTGQPLTSPPSHETGVRILMHSKSAARASEVPEPTERMGLSDVIGQKRVVAELQARVADAKKKPVPVIEPILILGEAGQGKTAIAHAIATDLGTRARVILAHHVKDPSTIVEAIREAPPGSVLFIDEIHKLPDDAALALYQPLEKPKITILAATNLPEELSNALLSRFGSHVRLGEYSEESLTEIVRRVAGSEVDVDACRRIAKASRGTPREAVNLTNRLLSMASGFSRTLDADTVGELLAVAGIDDRGLDAADRKIVGLLRAAERPLALATLAAKAGIRKAVSYTHLTLPTILRV